jgi:hypothetical protein
MDKLFWPNLIVSTFSMMKKQIASENEAVCISVADHAEDRCYWRPSNPLCTGGEKVPPLKIDLKHGTCDVSTSDTTPKEVQ